jgi:hypothetical protein
MNHEQSDAAGNTPISTPEDEVWANQSWDTLCQRLDEDKE